MPSPSVTLPNPTPLSTDHALERDAERAAQRAQSMPAASTQDTRPLLMPHAVPRAQTLQGGQPLSSASRRQFEPRFGVDLGHVRVHTDRAAAQHARDQRAEAYTQGADIVFDKDRYAPGTAGGDRLLAHELAHVVQQTAPAQGASPGPVTSRAAAPVLARSVDQWLSGSLNLTTLTYTQLVDEIDELSQWLQRQTSSSEDTVRIEEVLGQLRAEVNRRNRAAAGPARPEGRRRRGGRSPRPTSTAPPPERYPRVLIEMSSVSYTDPTEMRAEYDLIMQWLARPETSAAERRLLQTERANLEPQLTTDRAHTMRERHAGRVRAALAAPDPEAADALANLARTIQGISGEPGNPDLFYIYHQGERVAISREQAESLRISLRQELTRVGRLIDGRVSYYWNRYHSQVEINEEHPVISAISGWLADVADPGLELTVRYNLTQTQLGAFRGHLQAGSMVEAAQLVPDLDNLSQEIRVMARAFYEGYIEGAEIAVARLEFTRNASFAIAGAIAAVVAAPVVAGAVGTGGLGLTGVTATGATIVGTGATVGTGMAVVRGGSSAGGTLLAGGSLEEAGSAFVSEGSVGFREGFIAGAGGGAARVLGPLLGVGANVGQQVLRRIAAEAIINGSTAMADVLWRGGSISEAARAGAIAAAASVPGAVLGGSENPAVRQLIAPFTAGATTYASMRASGASADDAFAQACVAVASSVAMSRAAHGREADAALESRGRALGAAGRETLASGARRARSVAAAVMIGTADALPPLRSGYGSAPVTLEAPHTEAPRASVARLGGASARPEAEVAPPAARPDTDVAPTTAAPEPHTGESQPAAARAHDEPATSPAASTAEDTGAASTPVATADEAHAPATTSTVGTRTPDDDLNLDTAFSGPMDVSEPTTIGRTAASGRSRDFPSLERTALSAAQRAAAIALHGRRLQSRLAQIWNQTRNAREAAEIAAIRAHWNAGRHEQARALARAAFDRHRARFWRAVRRDPAARRVFTDAGMSFPEGSGAPVYVDPTTGEALDFMSLEHATRLHDDPTLALEASNLQTVLGDENSVALEAIRRTDPFQ